MKPKLVSIESPFAGDTERNIIYAQRAMKDSIERGEAPFVSHLLYPQVLDDDHIIEREMGFQISQAWLEWADEIIFYDDYGISPGMQRALDFAFDMEIKISYRQIGRNP